jgi:hypothetical protein
MSAPGFIDESRFTVEWHVDMGSTTKGALDVLTTALEGFASAEDIEIEKLVVGWRLIK